MFGKILSIFGNSKSSIADTLNSLTLDGILYHKTIGKPRINISQEATLSLSIVNESNFEYNLALTNEDYDNITEWKNMRFPIENDRGFKRAIEEGRDILFWESSKEFFIFVLLSGDQNDKNRETFFKTLNQLVTSNDCEIDLQKLEQNNEGDYIQDLKDIKNLDDFLDINYSKYDAYTQAEQANDVNNLTKAMENKLTVSNLYFKKHYPNAIGMFSGEGTLWKFDKDKDELILVSKNSNLQIFKIENFRYYLVVDEAKEEATHTCSSISQDTNIVFNRKEQMILWISKEEGEPVPFNFVFNDPKKLEEVTRLFAITQYEAASHSEFNKLNKEDQDWLENANMEEDESSDDQSDVEMELDPKFQESSSEAPNKDTAQAYLHDRTFVVRENNTIGVYKTDDEDILTHLANLPAVVKYEDKNIDIKNAHMFMSDTNMILLDKRNPNSAFKYDLGSGKVVEEWNAEGMKNIAALSQERKFDQMVDNQIMLGVNDKNLFTMDGRINKKNKVVNTKNYKTNPKLNCIATTNFGGIAVGSENGEIRLYKEVGKNAKTLLPCSGDPIKSIDVTADGRYLLATCDKYLILIDTKCKGDQNGFNVQMGKEKPPLKLLKIKPIDIAKYNLGTLKFTPARFNLSKESGETNIITSLGDHVVNWNFTKAKKGILDDYKIKKTNQFIVDNQFKYNKNQIVVTMENKLRIQNQKKLFEDK